MRSPAASTRTPMLALIAAVSLPIARAGWMMPNFCSVDSAIPLSDNGPNLWAIVQALPFIGTLQLTGLAMAAAIGAGFALTANWVARPPSPSQTLAAALLVALVLPGLLPGMTWADFLPAGAFGLALAVRRPAEGKRIAALILLAIVFATTGIPALNILGAGTIIAATILVARQFLVSPANDNGLPLNPFRVYPA